MSGNLIWISDFPLRGTSFGNVTLEMTRRIPNYKVYVLGLDYSGTPIAPFPGLDILPLKGVKPLDYYLRKLKPEKVIVFHSFYFLEMLKGVTFPDETYGFIPVEGDKLPANIIHNLLNFKELMVPSKYSQKILRKERINSSVVPHGVDTSFFMPRKVRNRKEFRWGYLGLNDIRKQIPRIMESYSRLPKKTRGSLTIAAPGEGHFNLLATAQGLGISPIWIEKKYYGIPLSARNLLSFYYDLDCYVNIATESFGLPNLEAAACGIPSIALDHGASREIMGGGALYVKIKDVLDTNIGQLGLADRDDLYKKMKVILEVPPERKRLVKAGLRRAEIFTWEKAIEKLMDVID